MTKLLEAAVAKVRELSEEEQDAAAEALLSFLQKDSPTYYLTREQVAEVKSTQREVREGNVATDDEMAVLWRKWGL